MQNGCSRCDDPARLDGNMTGRDTLQGFVSAAEGGVLMTRLVLHAAVGAIAAVSAAGLLDVAHAQGTNFVMKITLPTINDPSHLFAKNYAAAIERASGGRIKTEVYPASQLGAIPRQIEGTQFGAIQCVIIPPEFFVGVDERFEVLAAPGLVDSVEHAHRLTSDA